MAASSNVLVVGATPGRGKDFGADAVGSFAEARTYLSGHRPAVLVFGHTRNGEFDKFCKFALEQAPDSLWIVACDRLPPSTLIRWNEEGRLHDLIDDFDDPELESKVQSALEASGESAQRRKLVELFEDQSFQLKRLSSELEARVQRRHRALRKSLHKTEATKARMEAYHKALLGIHRAATALQMEQTLNDALRGAIDLEWVRIRFEAQSLIKRQSQKNVLAIELPYQFEKLHGEVLYSKAEGRAFSADESDFLYELTDAVALALARLQKLDQAETLKGQWQATFDAIPHPLCLVTADFEILKLNRAFREQAREKLSGTFHSLLGKRCFQTFFGSEFHPPAGRLESPFSFRQTRTGHEGSEHFEVSAQPLPMAFDNRTVHLILLRAITEEVRFERRILDASKLAELGTIGSSIAHELNNPLGGMLSFLQLILMDLKATDPRRTEIKAMEEAVLRCRDIVLNLLSFARKQDLGEFTEVDLWEVIDKSIKLIELQSKSQGTLIEYSRGAPAPVRASPNALSQAFCNLLQNAIDAIADRRLSEPGFQGRIRIELKDDGAEKHRLTITDNGMGIPHHVQSQIFNPHFTTRDPRQFGGMGLTTAFAIVFEHGGNLEMLSQTGSGTSAIVTLPRPD